MTMPHSPGNREVFPAATRLEVFSWAMYDFANSGYTTVVLTAIYNAYFVGVVAGNYNSGTATLLWTVAIGISNALVLLSAPVVGSIADHKAHKKRFLLLTTLGCTVFTAMLYGTGPDSTLLAMLLIILSNIMFASGENLIAAFLPEIASSRTMGRISGYGWSLGYFGGMLVLALCLAYVAWARSIGHDEAQFVPVTMLIVAVMFLLTALPTLLWLKERATPTPLPHGTTHLQAGFARLQATLRRAHHLKDLFRFIISLTLYNSGVYTVIVLAAVYAREVLGFDMQHTIYLIMIVNLTAAAGAFAFGHIQDRLGSVRTLALTLVLWIIAILVVYMAASETAFWIAANLIGISLGSCQSAGRALIGQLTPPGRSAEFFGLWGLAVKLSAILGPMSYGVIGYLSGGNHRAAVLSTLVFFIAGLLTLLSVNEARGHEAAQQPY
jgi:UMF1 family MFS transporter